MSTMVRMVMSDGKLQSGVDVVVDDDNGVDVDGDDDDDDDDGHDHDGEDDGTHRDVGVDVDDDNRVDGRRKTRTSATTRIIVFMVMTIITGISLVVLTT